MADDDKYPHLTALHEKYQRLNLRGLWQRDGRTAPELKPRIWRWSEMQPILEETLRAVRLPEDTDQRVIGLDVPGLSTGAVFISYQMINPGEKIPSHRAQFAPNHIAHPFFQLRVKGGPAAHGDREGGAAIHDHPARAIREAHAGDTQPRHSSRHPGMVGVAATHHIGHARPEWQVPRHHLDFLILGELPKQLACPRTDLFVA